MSNTTATIDTLNAQIQETATTQQVRDEWLLVMYGSGHISLERALDIILKHLPQLTRYELQQARWIEDRGQPVKLVANVTFHTDTRSLSIPFLDLLPTVVRGLSVAGIEDTVRTWLAAGQGD